MKILTSAKINLNLRVYPETHNKLHLLQTDMIPINIFDELNIEEAQKDSIEFDNTDLNNIDTTVHKSLRLIRKVNKKFDKKFNIFIKKNIPIESGLGGGSSNGGSILKFLCEYYDLEFPSSVLIAESIGSDVPFFVNSFPARVSGYGELITPLELNKEFSVVIAVPNITISTSQVFNQFDLLDNHTTISDYWNEIEIFNDLWEASKTLKPELGEIKSKLENTFQKVFFMSGSGSALFTFLEPEESLEHIHLNKINLRYFSVSKKIDCSFYQNVD